MLGLKRRSLGEQEWGLQDPLVITSGRRRQKKMSANIPNHEWYQRWGPWLQDKDKGLARGAVGGGLPDCGRREQGLVHPKLLLQPHHEELMGPPGQPVVPSPSLSTKLRERNQEFKTKQAGNALTLQRITSEFFVWNLQPLHAGGKPEIQQYLHLLFKSKPKTDKPSHCFHIKKTVTKDHWIKTSLNIWIFRKQNLKVKGKWQEEQCLSQCLHGLDTQHCSLFKRVGWEKASVNKPFQAKTWKSSWHLLHGWSAAQAAVPCTSLGPSGFF